MNPLSLNEARGFGFGTVCVERHEYPKLELVVVHYTQEFWCGEQEWTREIEKLMNTSEAAHIKSGFDSTLHIQSIKHHEPQRDGHRRNDDGTYSTYHLHEGFIADEK